MGRYRPFAQEETMPEASAKVTEVINPHLRRTKAGTHPIPGMRPDGCLRHLVV